MCKIVYQWDTEQNPYQCHFAPLSPTWISQLTLVLPSLNGFAALFKRNQHSFRSAYLWRIVFNQNKPHLAEGVEGRAQQCSAVLLLVVSWLLGGKSTNQNINKHMHKRGYRQFLLLFLIFAMAFERGFLRKLPILKAEEKGVMFCCVFSRFWLGAFQLRFCVRCAFCSRFTPDISRKTGFQFHLWNSTPQIAAAAAAHFRLYRGRGPCRILKYAIYCRGWCVFLFIRWLMDIGRLRNWAFHFGMLF